MREYSLKQELISLHIPKSGGTSFDRVLKKWFGLGFHRHYYNHAKEIPPSISNIGMFVKSIIPQCIHGHFHPEIDKENVFDYYPTASQFITIYRDPLELQLSYYFYQKKLIKDKAAFWRGHQVLDESFLGKDIDEHIEEKSDYNWLKHFIPFEINQDNFKDVITNNFIHIGITENMQRTVDIFADKLHKKTMNVPVENATIRLERPSESSIRKFKETNKLEYAFYEYVCMLNK